MYAACIFTRLSSILSLIIVNLRFKASVKVKLYTTSFYRYLYTDLKLFFPFTFVIFEACMMFLYFFLFSQAYFVIYLYLYFSSHGVYRVFKEFEQASVL